MTRRTQNRSTPITSLARFEELARAGQSVSKIFGAGSRRIAKLADIDATVTPGALDRAVDFVISTGSLDRYNSTIAVDGWHLDNFNKNPVVLWAHDDSIPAIARAENTRVVAGVLRSTARFAEQDAHPLADTIYRLIKGGFIGAASVGWVPLRYQFADRGDDGPDGIDYLEQELLEWSVVNIPANADCIGDARSFGVDTRPLADWCERTLDERRSDMNATALNALRRAAGGARSGIGFAGAGAARRDDGFVSLGEHLAAIAAACRAPETHDRRLIRTTASEGDPSAGGFLVGAQWATELVGFAYEQAVIAPLTDRRRTAAPLADVKVPAISETSRADGSRWGGVLAYWSSEADSMPLTFPQFRQLAFSSKKLVVAITVTNELLGDVPMLEAHIRRVFGDELAWKLDLAVFNGAGGMPLGVLNSPCLITVAKAEGQASATINAANVRAMWARLPAPSRQRAIWLVNEDADGQLDALTDVVGSAGVVPHLYQPAGHNGSPFPLLKGRPVIAIEQASVLGQVGDIVLGDFGHYVLIDGGVTPALSVHVDFSSDQSVWRFVLRCDGSPAFASPITSYNGSSVTRSPFVALAAR